jgi:hypothetical protein
MDRCACLLRSGGFSCVRTVAQYGLHGVFFLARVGPTKLGEGSSGGTLPGTWGRLLVSVRGRGCTRLVRLTPLVGISGRSYGPKQMMTTPLCVLARLHSFFLGVHDYTSFRFVLSSGVDYRGTHLPAGRRPRCADHCRQTVWFIRLRAPRHDGESRRRRAYIGRPRSSPPALAVYLDSGPWAGGRRA